MNVVQKGAPKGGSKETQLTLTHTHTHAQPKPKKKHKIILVRLARDKLYRGVFLKRPYYIVYSGGDTPTALFPALGAFNRVL